jgi:hypothetical protein
MVSPKRRLTLKLRRRRVEKREKDLKLTPKERAALLRKRADLIVPDGNPLAKVSEAHGRNFIREVISISGQFPGEEIEVLDDGSGHSSVHSQLPIGVSETSGGRIKANVTRTDVYERAEFDVRASPEQLLEKFGRNHFHMIISTFGGIHFTEVNRRKAFANLIAVLKPKGLASIAIADVPETVGIAQYLRPAIRACKSYSNISLLYKIVPFTSISGRKYNSFVITMRKK